MGAHAKFTFASGQRRDSRQDSERPNPQRIRFCYKIQLKIISRLDLIFHHIVIVHSNLLRRNLTQHVEGLEGFFFFSPCLHPKETRIYGGRSLLGLNSVQQLVYKVKTMCDTQRTHLQTWSPNFTSSNQTKTQLLIIVCLTETNTFILKSSICAFNFTCYDRDICPALEVNEFIILSTHRQRKAG